ncbi:hypothetical protein TIFTF001_016873 [Ficus carica]|uniref:Uncharacterized protein n=1 Tax=Ficus carica TaxID=3494 RepID=A0AA88DIX5_FICCA|nr:hypothetical protein TIFTF001_016873 [Ficus carica]
MAGSRENRVTMRELQELQEFRDDSEMIRPPMVIVGGFGAELAEFGERKLSLLDLGMNLGSYLIFLCIDLE